MPKAFIQGLSPILSLALVCQLAFANLALAQNNSTQNNSDLANYDQDPFWSNKQTVGGQVNPNDPSFWFNNNNPAMDQTGETNNGDDPWGNWDNPGDNGNPFNTGNWGDQGSDPFGVYGGWNSNNYVTKMTDPLFVKLMRATGAISKNYMATIHNYRAQYSAYGTEDDDAIAEIIIKKHMKYVGWLGAGAAVVPPFLDYVWKEWRGQQSSFGYGIGVALGGLGDFMAIIAQEASMMFELQALYGELSNDDDDRTASTIMPFILGMGGASLNKLVSHKLRLDVLNPVKPNPPVKPGPDPDPFKPSAKLPPEMNMPPADGPVQDVTKSPLASPLANETAQLVEWATLKGKLVQWFLKNIPGATKIVKGKTIAAHLVETMPPVYRVIASAIVAAGFSYEMNRKSCYYFGEWAKRYYKAMHQVDLASVIHQLRSNSEAKAALWLILLKDVFQNPDMNLADAKMYAAIISREMPLVKTAKWDELAALQRDYRAHPDMLDAYLKDLRNDLPVDAKLYMVKLILGGMLMKGGMDRQDIMVMKNFAIAMGLYQPDKVNLSSFKPDDQRLIDRDRYLELKNRMLMDTKEENMATSRSKLPKDKNYVPARWGRSGQIVLQDFEDSDVKPMVNFFDQVKKNGGLEPSSIGNANSLGNKVAGDSGNPMTNKTPQDPFNESGNGNSSGPQKRQ